MDEPVKVRSVADYFCSRKVSFTKRNSPIPREVTVMVPQTSSITLVFDSG